MALCKLIALFACIISLAVCDLQDTGTKKLNRIRKLQERANNGIIEFTPEQYEELVLENPRPYDVVMLFSVKQSCPICDSLYTELIGAEYSFTRAQQNVFFGVIYASQEPRHRAVFLRHGFKTAPLLCTSQQQSKRDDLNDKFYKPEDIQKFNNVNEVHETQFIIDFINKRFNTDVQLTLPLQTIVIKNLIFFGVLFFLLNVLVKLRETLINQKLWLFVAILGFVICTSGIVYAKLHNMPMFRMDTDEYGNHYIGEFFNRGNRSQWGGEGYIVSFLCAAISGAFYFIVNVPKIADGPFQKRLFSLGGLIVAYALITCYIEIYRLKTPWYNPKFFPPGDYVRGPIMRDQGNNI